MPPMECPSSTTEWPAVRSDSMAVRYVRARFGLGVDGVGAGAVAVADAALDTNRDGQPSELILC